MLLEQIALELRHKCALRLDGENCAREGSENTYIIILKTPVRILKSISWSLALNTRFTKIFSHE